MHKRQGEVACVPSLSSFRFQVCMSKLWWKQSSKGKQVRYNIHILIWFADKATLLTPSFANKYEVLSLLRILKSCRAAIDWELFLFCSHVPVGSAMNRFHIEQAYNSLWVHTIRCRYADLQWQIHTGFSGPVCNIQDTLLSETAPWPSLHWCLWFGGLRSGTLEYRSHMLSEECRRSIDPGVVW